MQPQAVLHFAFAEIVQIGLPVPIMNKVIGDVFRYKNVARFTAIEDALGDINASPRNIDPVVHIRHLVDRSAVDSHPHLNSGRAS